MLDDDLKGSLPRTPLQWYLCSVRVLVLQLLQVQLVDLPKNQQLPVQELHLLLHRFTVGKLGREMEQNPTLG